MFRPTEFQIFRMPMALDDEMLRYCDVAIKHISSLQFLRIAFWRFYGICCLGFGISTSLMAQDSLNYSLIKTIDKPITKFTTDPFKNIYTIDKDNEIVKYNANGDLLYRFGVRENGPIHSIDATNPFKVLVFYAETNQLVVLDNNLSEVSNTDLFDLSLLSVLALCSAQNDAVWFFDNFNQKLMRINNQLEISQEGENLNETFEIDLNPNFMLEYENHVYVNDSTQGIFIFDTYGNFEKSFPILGISDFQIINNQLIYFLNRDLNIKNLTLLTESKQPLPTGFSGSAARIHSERMYLLEAEQLHLYAF